MRRVCLIFAVAVATGCASTPMHTLRFHEEVPGNLPGSRVRQVRLPDTGQQIYVDPFPSISEKDVDGARLETTNAGAAVLVQLNSHGAVTLSEMTTRLRGQYFVVLVDEKPVAAILVERIMKDGKFLLLGNLTDVEAKELVASLNKLAGHSRDFGDTRLAP